MNEFKQHAQYLIAQRDFVGLDKFLMQPPDGCGQLAAELALLSLVEQGRSFEQLEAPLDQYLGKYLDSVPVSNLEMAAQLKFRLKKFDDAVRYAGMVLDKKDDQEIAEIAAISLFNLEKNKMGSRLVEQLINTKSSDIKYYEWNILFKFKLEEYQTVLENWEKIQSNGAELSQKNSVLVFVIRSYIYCGLIERARNLSILYELDKQSDDIEIGLMLAELAKAQEDFDTAEKILRNLVRLHPEVPECKWNLSLILLRRGNLKEGWDFYEVRWEWSKFPSSPRKFDAPRWDGKESLESKNILVWGEQGVGDQLRFFTLLSNMITANPNAKITLECDAKINSLVKAWYPELIVQPFGMNDTTGLEEYSHFDYQYPCGSLPRLYFQSLDSISVSKFRRLKISRDARENILSYLPKNRKLVVGISWRSMLLMKSRVDDYFGLNAFEELIKRSPSDIGFISLQYDISPEEKSQLSRYPNVLIPEHDFLNDVYANGLHCGACDVLFSVGTVVATCAGIFGVPVVSWSRFDDPVNLGQEQNPWFPNRFDFRTMPNWDKQTLLERLIRVLNSYYQNSISA